ncbi:MAG: hypothetical protein ACP5QU_07595 [Anaerolineae bacterium]
MTTQMGREDIRLTGTADVHITLHRLESDLMGFLAIYDLADGTFTAEFGNADPAAFE